MKKITISITIALFLVLCSCAAEPKYEDYCDKCDSGILKDCSIFGFDPWVMCPYCANSMIWELVSGERGICTNCGNLYFTKFSGEYGLCEDCEWDVLDPCSGCGEYMYGWSENVDLRFCPACMGRMIEDPNVQDALIEWHEGYQ